MEQTNQTIEPTWGIVLKIWWWTTWRSLALSLVSGFFFGFIVGIFFVTTGIRNPIIIKSIPLLLGATMGLSIYLFFFKKIIGKKFKNFTLVLIKNE